MYQERGYFILNVENTYKYTKWFVTQSSRSTVNYRVTSRYKSVQLQGDKLQVTFTIQGAPGSPAVFIYGVIQVIDFYDNNVCQFTI